MKHFYNAFQFIFYFFFFIIICFVCLKDFYLYIYRQLWANVESSINMQIQIISCALSGIQFQLFFFSFPFFGRKKLLLMSYFSQDQIHVPFFSVTFIMSRYKNEYKTSYFIFKHDISNNNMVLTFKLFFSLYFKKINKWMKIKNFLEREREITGAKCLYISKMYWYMLYIVPTKT